MMITLIAKNYLREMFRDGRLIWAGGLIVILLITSIAVGWQHHQSITAERIAAQALDYDDWISQKKRHPHDAAHQGMHVFKPEPPLVILDPGITPYVGSTQWLQSHKQSEVKFRPAQDATGLQRFGNLSPAWILQTLCPLLIIILGFNAISAEREQGTLRQILSFGIQPLSILWGKAVGLFIGLGVLLVPIGVVSTIAIVMNLEHQLAIDTLWRIGLLTTAYIAYFAITIFFVLAISASTRSSKTSLIILIGVWITMVTLAPRVLSDMSRVWFPSPSRAEFTSSLDKDLNTEYVKEWQRNFNVDKRWSADLPLNRWGKALQVDDQAGYVVSDKHFESLWDTFEQQKYFQEWLGIVVPLLPLRSLSMAIAGSDFAHHRDFSTAAERHRRFMQDLISDDLIKHADTLDHQHFSYQAGPELWAKVPRFSYDLPKVSFAINHTWRAFLILLVVLVITVIWATIVSPRRA